MAKHRTRKQKAKTQAHRGVVRAPAVPVAQELQIEQSQSLLHTPDVQKIDLERRKAAIGQSQQSPLPPTQQSLLRVDERYLRADLRRSAIVSVVLFSVLIGIWLLVRYNGLTSIQSYYYSILQMMGK